MCWVLDGGLRCVCVCVQWACAFARVLMCVFVSICARARARACMRACVSACAGSCDSIRLHFRVCV